MFILLLLFSLFQDSGAAAKLLLEDFTKRAKRNARNQALPLSLSVSLFFDSARSLCVLFVALSKYSSIGSSVA
jgi:hypothetical protein